MARILRPKKESALHGFLKLQDLENDNSEESEWEDLASSKELGNEFKHFLKISRSQSAL